MRREDENGAAAGSGRDAESEGGMTALERLAKRFPAGAVSVAALRRVTERYPMRLTPYLLSRLGEPGGPLWRQFVPDLREVEDAGKPAGPASPLADDPLAEERQMPTPGLIHRYPDRVVFLVSDRCAAYCRFCMRKRRVGKSPVVPDAVIERGLDYIRRTGAIRDVILSGGDPLLLPDRRLDAILAELRAIPHVETVRVHTRIPGVLPSRVTPALVALLARHRPLFVNIHVNHPAELTPEMAGACARLADAGIPLGSQTVLLAGVNDDVAVLRDLFRGLLRLRVRPYYLHQADLVRGTRHFHTPLERSLALLEGLRGHVSGMAVPQFMVDLPGGAGKIPLLPGYVLDRGAEVWRVRAWDGAVVAYPVENSPEPNPRILS